MRPQILASSRTWRRRRSCTLDATLVGGAGFSVNAMVANFGPDDGVAYTQAEKQENYRPVNIGQLKAVAKPFYDRLKAAGFDNEAGVCSARLSLASGATVVSAFDVAVELLDRPRAQTTQFLRISGSSNSYSASI